MCSLYRHPVTHQGEQFEVMGTGVYVDGKVYCHLAHIDNKQRQICDYVPIEAIFCFDNPELIKRIANFKSYHIDEICIAWNPLYQDGLTQGEVLMSIRQGVEAGIFRHEYGYLWSGQTLHLNTRPTRVESVGRVA